MTYIDIYIYIYISVNHHSISKADPHPAHLLQVVTFQDRNGLGPVPGDFFWDGGPWFHPNAKKQEQREQLNKNKQKTNKKATLLLKYF